LGLVVLNVFSPVIVCFWIKVHPFRTQIVVEWSPMDIFGKQKWMCVSSLAFLKCFPWSGWLLLVDFPLTITNTTADEQFGVDGWRAVEVPSEIDKDLAKNHLLCTALSQRVSTAAQCCALFG
jgi:hypothetical protein